VAELIPITDADDERVSDFAGLRQPDRRIAYESVHGVFVGEGALVARRMLSHETLVIRSVFTTERRLADVADLLVGRDLPVYVAAPAVLRTVVGFDLHRGIVVSAERFALPALGSVLAAARRVLVLERVNDHENLGAMFRSAAALGIDAVVLCPECSDPLYRRCVRVSMGHVLAVPFTRAPDWPADLGRIADHGFTTVALTPTPPAVPIASLHLDPDERVALVAGAEGPGLRPEVIAAAAAAARIPMHAGVDSLNVATAVAIAAYELGRDQSASPG
jgi:tRNA G18 (ribose-2'-O)-methylase SpoU